MGARKSPMMAGFQAEENLTGRAPKKCAKNSGRYQESRFRHWLRKTALKSLRQLRPWREEDRVRPQRPGSAASRDRELSSLRRKKSRDFLFRPQPGHFIPIHVRSAWNFRQKKRPAPKRRSAKFVVGHRRLELRTN